MGWCKVILFVAYVCSLQYAPSESRAFVPARSLRVVIPSNSPSAIQTSDSTANQGQSAQPIQICNACQKPVYSSNPYNACNCGCNQQTVAQPKTIRLTIPLFVHAPTTTNIIIDTRQNSTEPENETPEEDEPVSEETPTPDNKPDTEINVVEVVEVIIESPNTGDSAIDAHANTNVQVVTDDVEVLAENEAGASVTPVIEEKPTSEPAAPEADATKPPVPKTPETNPEPKPKTEESKPSAPATPGSETKPNPKPETNESKPTVPKTPETNPEPQPITEEPKPTPSTPATPEPETKPNLQPKTDESIPPVPQTSETNPEPQPKTEEPKPTPSTPATPEPETKPNPQPTPKPTTSPTPHHSKPKPKHTTPTSSPKHSATSDVPPPASETAAPTTSPENSTDEPTELSRRRRSVTVDESNFDYTYPTSIYIITEDGQRIPYTGSDGQDGQPDIQISTYKDENGHEVDAGVNYLKEFPLKDGSIVTAYFTVVNMMSWNEENETVATTSNTIADVVYDSTNSNGETVTQEDFPDQKSQQALEIVIDFGEYLFEAVISNNSTISMDIDGSVIAESTSIANATVTKVSTETQARRKRLASPTKPTSITGSAVSSTTKSAKATRTAASSATTETPTSYSSDGVPYTVTETITSTNPEDMPPPTPQVTIIQNDDNSTEVDIISAVEKEYTLANGTKVAIDYIIVETIYENAGTVTSTADTETIITNIGVSESEDDSSNEPISDVDAENEKIMVSLADGTTLEIDLTDIEDLEATKDSLSATSKSEANVFLHGTPTEGVEDDVIATTTSNAESTASTSESDESDEEPSTDSDEQ